jgi:hypothetical protein
MRIMYQDGSFETCLPTDQRQISVSMVLIRPERLPKVLKKVWDEPPTYARLAVARCSMIPSGAHVMTSDGLKRVASVEQ